MTEHENDYDDYRQREIKRLLADTIFYLQEASEHPDSIAGIPTGFRDLDCMTGGLQRGDLIVIAGRPNMGKTALAMNIAEAVAIGAREAVALFSLAQPDHVLMLRLLSSLSGIAHDRLRKGDITDEGAREKLALAVRQLVEAPLDISDDLNLTAADLHTQTRRLQEKHGALGLILIDDLQMIEQDNPGDNRMTTVDRIMRSLKLLAREMYAPAIVLS
jgi:replicative DNA helicase